MRRTDFTSPLTFVGFFGISLIELTKKNLYKVLKAKSTFYMVIVVFIFFAALF